MDLEHRLKKKKWASLNSPKLLKGFPRGKCLRAEALGWHDWKNTSLDVNQSFPSKIDGVVSEDMEWLRGESMTSISSRKWAINQSPVHISSSREDAWLLSESNFNSSTHPSNSPFESNVLISSITKAVFTILLPSTEILIVNSEACKLLGYAAEELCTMKLKDLLLDPQQLTAFNANQQDNVSDGNRGSVVELTTRDGLRLPVFLFLKRIDSPQRCVAVAELVDRRVATLNVDSAGKITGCDDEVATMFQYDFTELHGYLISSLIPALSLNDTGQNEKSPKQRVTGRTKAGASFPLCALTRRNGPDGFQVVVWVYSNLSGVFLLNQDLTISNCNHHFTTLLFGYTKDSLLNQSILKLIPTFCEDGEYGRDRTITADRSEETDSEDNPEQSCNGEVDSLTTEKDNDRDKDCLQTNESINEDCLVEDSVDDYLNVEINDSIKDCGDKMVNLRLGSVNRINECVIDEADCDLQNEITEKLTLLKDTEFRVWNTESRIRNSKSDDVLAKARQTEGNCQVVGATSNLNLKGTGLKEFPMNRALNVSNLSDLDGEKPPRQVREGTYSGVGRHRDGGDIDVVYRVKTARGRSGYCVCVSRDPWEAAEGGRNLPSNLTITSSINSTSMEASMNKDSESHSRPNSASIISQSDDVLTCGEYSEYYTNLQQIGKGAFGYVKMAYRNQDGLLVITKFIKKHKIHIRSWVLDPTLQMKVPLEISLLTALDHPNIVRVLDVFHNESFFQLVMEKHGAGMDLFEFIDRKPKMDEKLAAYIFRQMVTAVHYLNSLGILHRDIKDENVIINEVFHVKLIDFGSATFIKPDRPFSTFYGTVEYCSPEVLQGNKYRGPELEIWALGVTLYVLIFGENPFYDVEETIKGEFVIPRAISSNLFSLIKGMLEKDVALRWDINRIYLDTWVNQPVNPTSYSFQQVVRCYHDEAYPAKYISEYAKEDVLKEEEEDDDRTVASSNSFCSLHTLENLDEPDQMLDAYKTPVVIKDTFQRLLPLSPYILSSTPRRASATKAISGSNRNFDAIGNAHKRYSLDLNTLKKLCDGPESTNFTNLFQVSVDPSSNGSQSVENLKNLDFLDSLENKAGNDDFENYWDAEDEQYDEDSY